MTDLSRLLNGHRSIRRYKPGPIARELIDEVCADAMAGASSSGNLNNVSLVLTQDVQRRQQLYELHARQPMILQAPLLVTFVADCYRTRRWLTRGAARDNFNNLMGYHIALCDAMIVAQNVCLGFEARGLGVCYMGSTLSAMSAIAAALNLPDTCVPAATIVAGYPDENPDKRDRLPMSALIHDEFYRDPSDEEIDASYAEREQRAWPRHMASPAGRSKLEQHGIRSMAQLYSSPLKYDPEVFRSDSQRLREFLELKNFIS
jgi:nitroreductase